MQGGLHQLRSTTKLKALAKRRNHPKGEECCDMSFEGLSPEVMCPNSQGKVVVLTAGFQAVEASPQAAS